MDAAKQNKLICGKSADGYIIRVDGRGTMRESPILHELGTSCLSGRADSHLTVDLSACDYLDSTFLGCLVALQKHGTVLGPDRFVIAAPAERRKALLSASALDRYFDQTDVVPSPIDEMVTIALDRIDNRTLGRHLMECHQALAQVEGPQQEAFARISERLARELKEDREE